MHELYESLVKQLDDYSKEIGLHSNFTLGELIASHRYLRNEHIKKNKENLNKINKAIEEGIQSRLTYDYVDTKTFFDMSLRQIINQYYEE
jgi:hypothetical protein